MKRLFFGIILVALLLVTTFAIAATTYYVSTDIDAINVRDAVDKDVIYGAIRAGNKINVDYTKGDWAYFTYHGHDAKAYLPYLTTSLSSETSDSTDTQYTSRSSGKPKVSTDEASMIFVVNDSVKDSITVRKSKSSNGKIIGKLYPGDEIYVIKEGTTWSRIIYNNGYAFVKSQYIHRVSFNLPEEGELCQVSVKEGTTLNVRNGPGKKKRLITRLSNGAFVKRLEDDGKWSNILYAIDKGGYVMSKFLIPSSR